MQFSFLLYIRLLLDRIVFNNASDFFSVSCTLVLELLLIACLFVEQGFTQLLSPTDKKCSSGNSDCNYLNQRTAQTTARARV